MTSDQGRVLVVDDHKPNRIKISFAVKKLGHIVEAAEDGRQALEMLREQPFDLVLLDILMPELDGYQVLERMKADSALRHIPVIVISAEQELDSVVKGIELGAEDYLPKTFDLVLLRARISACLEKKRFRDQEIEYLRQVERLTEAAALVEAATFAPDGLGLESLTTRPDALGRLARVFLRMAREVHVREQRLKQQVQELRIEVDHARQRQQVSKITGTDYFRELRGKAGDLRNLLEGEE
ncbi:MAG TPA: response regulator [Roseiflexaceae bacterium]|nr:response regulator [Roseiflexaceae bacterium]